MFGSARGSQKPRLAGRILLFNGDGVSVELSEWCDKALVQPPRGRWQAGSQIPPRLACLLLIRAAVAYECCAPLRLRKDILGGAAREVELSQTPANDAPPPRPSRFERQPLLPGRTAHLKERLAKIKEQMRAFGQVGELKASEDQLIPLPDPDGRSMATSGRGTGIVGCNV